MKRLFTIIAISLITQPIYAQKRVKIPVTVYLGTAITHNNLDWSIAGNIAGESPNILSEVSWRNLKGTAINASLEVPILKSLYLIGSFSRSEITKGNATDTDYAEDNRTNPVFKAELNSNDGYLANYQLKAGYHFDIGGVKLSPNIGYVNHTQYLHLTEADLPALNSTYKTFWEGFSTGVELHKYVKKFSLTTALDYHQVNYHAEANWNLIDEFKHPVSFSHIAKGFGLTTNLKLLYRINKNIAPFINFDLCYWSTGAGIDELYYEDGRIARTRLIDVSRNGYDLGLGLKLILK